MAVLTTYSDLAKPRSTGAGPNAPPNRRNFVLRGMRFIVTQGSAAGDIGSTLILCTIPQRGRYLADQSFLSWSACGAGCLVSLGWQAYRLPTDALVPASAAGLGGPLDVAAAGNARLNTLTAAVLELEFAADAVLQLTVSGAVIPAAAVIQGAIYYALAY